MILFFEFANKQKEKSFFPFFSHTYFFTSFLYLLAYRCSLPLPPPFLAGTSLLVLLLLMLSDSSLCARE